jgi:17beta-estradiol 17-dehydrogenase / very-long-chain 3-oxoacyl-CoA reductase
MDALPKPAAQALAAVGLIYLTSKVWSFLRLLASLFILPGESVNTPATPLAAD